MTRRGVDTSHWQHPSNRPIDWPAVRRGGVSWAAIKLTEGRSFVDPWAARDLAGAKAAGLEVVLYHFARPTQSSPGQQADHFLTNVQLVGGADAAALDVEDGRQMGWRPLGAWVGDYLHRGAAQIVYYDQSYRSALRPHLALGPVHEWVALWSAGAPPAGCSVWQRGQAAIPGIPARVDIDDVFYDRPLTAIGRGGPPVVPVAGPVGPHRALHRGDQGDDVRALQRALTDHGYPVVVDGIFGDLTLRAVDRFQHDHGIEVDGWAGAAVRHALGME